jgi:hypothetical protein
LRKKPPHSPTPGNKTANRFCEKNLKNGLSERWAVFT